MQEKRKYALAISYNVAYINQRDVMNLTRKVRPGAKLRMQCELILKMAEDQRMKAIAESPVSYTEKLQQVGKLMYGKDWK